MKKSILSTILLFSLYLPLSCQTDDLIQEHSETKKTLSQPDNPNNPYNYIGALQNTVLDDYYINNYNFSDIIAIANKVNDILVIYNPQNEITVSIDSIFQSRITQITNYPESSLRDIILEINATEKVHSRIYELFDILSDSSSDYLQQLNSIFTLETEVITSTLLKEKEKEYLLMITSATSFSIYYDNGDDDDKDWDLSIGTLIVSAYGFNYTEQDGLLFAISAKIFQNSIK